MRLLNWSRMKREFHVRFFEGLRGKFPRATHQMSWNKNFLKRFLFGTSKAYVQQLEVGKTYSTLCPVYGLALANVQFEEKTEDWFHHYKLTNVRDMDKTLEGMELIFLELPKFSPQTFEHRKIGILWLRFLRETRDLENIPDEFKESPEVVSALKLSEESAYTPAELEAYDQYLDAIRVEQMLREDSYEEGSDKKAQAIAKQMIRKGYRLEDICDMTGLTMEVVRSLAAEDSTASVKETLK